MFAVWILIGLLVGLMSPPVQAQSVARPLGSGPGPWRATDAMGLSWLRLGLEQRSRYEMLQDDFRASHQGDASGLFLRTLINAELRWAPWGLGAELQDSRGWVSDGTPINNTLVNAAELLQGYVFIRGRDVFCPGDNASVKAGRLTIDLGSRRLLARNEYRNTINSFTGVDIQWSRPSGDMWRALAVLPVVRQPADGVGLRSNTVTWDRENSNALLWALFWQSGALVPGVTAEAYVVGLHERDGVDMPSSHRQLITPGLRILRPPGPGVIDFQLELMGQVGRSRVSAATSDTVDLQHQAYSVHLEAGWRWAAAWAPRLALLYDVATGDASSEDHINNRFDPLFGARRFDWGPTGLYGALSRSNIVSPGTRLEIQPHRSVDAFAAYRMVSLASAADMWVAAGRRDPWGSGAPFLGQQWEGRIRWHLLPGNVSIEAGAAWLVRGPWGGVASDEGNPVLAYTQVTATL